ncbi:hypothetical protein ACFQ9X_19365 [Catenulispora yoronensis]
MPARRRGELDDLAERGGLEAARLTERILGAVRGGAPDPALLEQDLDELERLAVGTGLGGLTTSSRAYVKVQETTDGHSVAYVFVCPTRVCSRRVIEYQADPLPEECAVAGGPLTKVRLDL